MKTNTLNIYKKKLEEKKEQMKSSFQSEAESYKKYFWTRRSKSKSIEDIELELNSILIN